MVGVQRHRQLHHLQLVQVVLVEHRHGQDQAVLLQFVLDQEAVLQFGLEVPYHLVRLLHQVLRVVQVEQQLQLRRLHVQVLRNHQREFKNQQKQSKG
jgi:hypothetical protein